MNTELPRFEWYVHEINHNWVSNVWSGSFGTRGNEGVINTYSFNYRVDVDQPGTEYARFRAEWHIQVPWRETASTPPKSETAFFDYSDEGLTLTSDWLDKSLTLYLKGEKTV